MAYKFTFEVKGLNSLLKTLKDYPKEIQEDALGAIESNVLQISSEQKRLAPVHIGNLRQNTGWVQDPATGSYILFSNAEYAPFIEFGTGTKVKIPGELTAYAAQFKGKRSGGSFNLFVRQLEIWVKRKGLDISPKFLAILILRNGIKAQPFFFEPFFVRRPKIIADVKKAIGAK